MQNRGCVFELPGLAYDCSLAVTLGLSGLYAESSHAFLAQQSAQLFADVHQLGQILVIAPGKRILDHRDGHRSARWRLDHLAHLDARLVHLDDQFSDFGFHVQTSLSAARPYL
jgi:hypothetical protein